MRDTKIIHIPFILGGKSIKERLAEAVLIVPDGKKFEYIPSRFVKSEYGNFWTIPEIEVTR